MDLTGPNLTDPLIGLEEADFHLIAIDHHNESPRIDPRKDYDSLEGFQHDLAIVRDGTDEILSRMIEDVKGSEELPAEAACVLALSYFACKVNHHVIAATAGRMALAKVEEHSLDMEQFGLPDGWLEMVQKAEQLAVTFNLPLTQLSQITR